MKIGDLYWALRADGAQLEPDMNKAAQKAGDSAGQTLGSRMSAKIRTAIGAGLGTLFVGAVDAATTFQDQLATINTVAKISDDQLQKIGDDIQELSRTSGKTTDDLTQGFYDLVSAGVPADKAMKTLNDSAILAIGSLGSTAEAVDLVTSSLGAYNIDASQSKRITDIWAQSVADGKTTVAELAGGISQVAPIAAAAGVSLEEVAAQTAIMTVKGDSASQAMVRIKTAISALLTPNATLNEIQNRTHLNFAELAKDKGLAVALNELRKATKGNNDEFGKALGASEALTLAFAITGDNADAMAAELDKVKASSDDGGQALSQYAIKSGSAAEAGKRLAAQIQTFIQDVGGPFVNSVGPAVFALNQLSGAFGKGGIAAKLFGGIVGGITGKFLPNLKNALVKAFAAAEIGTRAETLGLKLQTALIKGLTVKDRIVDALGMLWEKVLYSGPVQKVIGIAGAAASAVYAAAVGVGSKIAEALTAAWARIATSTAVGGAITAAIGSAAAAAVGVFAAAAALAALAAPAIIFLAVIKLTGFADGNTPNPLGIPQIDAGNAKWQAFRASFSQQGQDAGRAAGEATGSAYVDAAVTSAGRQWQQGAEKFGDAMVAAFRKSPALAGTGVVVSQVVSSSIGAHVNWIKVAREQGNRAGAALAQGIRDRDQAVSDSWQLLIDTMHNALSPAKKRAQVLGELTSSTLAKALHDKRPEVREQAEATKQALIDRLATLHISAKNIGADGMAQLRKGMKSKDPDIKAAATAIYNSIHNKLGTLNDNAQSWGRSIGQGLASGLLQSIGRNIIPAALAVANAIAAFTQTHSPAKEGPLSEDGGPEGYGRNIGSGIASGLASTLPNLSSILGGFQLPGSPALATAGVGSLGSAPVMAGATNNFNLTVQGLIKAESTLDVAREMRRVARFGATAERARPSAVAKAETK